MKKRIKFENEFGDIHERIEVSGIDIEKDSSKCAYCSLENECMQNTLDLKNQCGEKHLYRTVE